MQNSKKITNLDRLITRLYSQAPLIGWELRRMAVKALAQEGSSEAMDALAEAFIRSDDSHVREAAFKALQQLAIEGKAEAQDALCRLVIEHDHPRAREIVFAAQYIPHDPNQQILFVNLLTEALIHNDDSQVCQSALKILVKLAKEGKPEAQEALCRLVIEHDYASARKVVLAAQYAPRNPYQRALLYVLTAQWDKYEQLDFDHRLLRTIYRIGDRRLQKRIIVSTRQGGRVDLLASFATGGQQVDRMTDEDWEAMLTVLSKDGEWAEIWQLAQAAPVKWSMRLLLRLKNANWMPQQETERAEFTQLVRLAEECSQREADTLGWLVYCHTTLGGHTDDVRCLVISPNGQMLASGSNDNTVRLWELPEGEELKTLSGHTRIIPTYLPYWAYRRRSALKTLRGHTHIVTCLAISPDGKMLASGGGDNTVRLWSMPGGMVLQSLKGHTDEVRCLAISPDGQMLVSGSGDNTLRLWNLPDGTTLKTLENYTDDVRCLAISPDGRLLVSGSGDNMVRLWSLPDGEMLHTLEGHSDSISCLAISPDGRVLASGSDDHTIRLWSLPDGVALKALRGHTAEVSCLTISPNGRVLASGGVDKAVRLWVLGQVDLSCLIVGYTSVKELQLLQERTQEEEAADTERTWLKFILALIRWQRRFDIEVGEISHDLPGGRFDIEIEEV